MQVPSFLLLMEFDNCNDFISFVISSIFGNALSHSSSPDVPIKLMNIQSCDLKNEMQAKATATAKAMATTALSAAKCNCNPKRLEKRQHINIRECTIQNPESKIKINFLATKHRL